MKRPARALATLLALLTLIGLGGAASAQTPPWEPGRCGTVLWPGDSTPDHPLDCPTRPKKFR